MDRPDTKFLIRSRAPKQMAIPATTMEQGANGLGPFRPGGRRRSRRYAPRRGALTPASTGAQVKHRISSARPISGNPRSSTCAISSSANTSRVATAEVHLRTGPPAKPPARYATTRPTNDPVTSPSQSLFFGPVLLKLRPAAM
jgi:hypothetical protein